MSTKRWPLALLPLVRHFQQCRLRKQMDMAGNNKPIDFIIMAGKGGGADEMGLMQAIVEKEDLANRPLFQQINLVVPGLKP